MINPCWLAFLATGQESGNTHITHSWPFSSRYGWHS